MDIGILFLKKKINRDESEDTDDGPLLVDGIIAKKESCNGYVKTHIFDGVKFSLRYMENVQEIANLEIEKIYKVVGKEEVYSEPMPYCLLKIKDENGADFLLNPEFYINDSVNYKFDIDNGCIEFTVKESMGVKVPIIVSKRNNCAGS